MLGSDDTIAAVATPPGQGGVGIVRLSGPQACAIGERVFTPTRRGAGRRSHRLVHGILRDPASGAVAPHHHPEFDIDERCLPVGVEVMTRSALAALAVAGSGDKR